MVSLRRTILVLPLVLLLVGCTDVPSSPESPAEVAEMPAHLGSALPDGPHQFAPPVFGIDAAPNGNILVAATAFPAIEPTPGETTTTTVKEIHRGGIRDLAEITHPLGSPINGLATVGRAEFFATNGGMDRAVAAGVWRVSSGRAELVADIEAFETERDPDALEGPRWKNPLCEGDPFSPGPQSNPYHMDRLSGSTVLVGDAAGNTVLSVRTDGEVDWVALLTPPTETGEGSDDPEDWMVLFPLDEDTDCYVQPVATSVAIGPDGAYYAGELTGVTPADIGLGSGPSTGLSRVWRIEPGSRNVVCPSDDCEVVLSGFTSIIDLAFGPDQRLHVVEYDEAGWFTAVQLGSPTSGTIHSCDVMSGDCTVAQGDLDLPAAITFDKWGDLWVLENNLGFPFLGTGTPTVSRIQLP